MKRDARQRNVVACAVTRPVIVVGGASLRRLAIGICIVVGDWCAGCPLNHVIDQIFLASKTIDGILVLNDPRDRFIKGDGVDTISIWIGHGVVDIVGAPPTPRPSDKHVVKSRSTGHVDVERGFLGKRRGHRGKHHRRSKEERGKVGWHHNLVGCRSKLTCATQIMTCILQTRKPDKNSEAFVERTRLVSASKARRWRPQSWLERQLTRTSAQRIRGRPTNPKPQRRRRR